MPGSATFLAKAVLGKSGRWPDALGLDFYERFMIEAHYHGVLPLFHRAIKRGLSVQEFPDSLIERVDTEARQLAVQDMIIQRELESLLAALRKRQLRPLLIKGAALANWLYPSPELRPRADTDLIVRRVEAETVSRILAELGYVRRIESGGTTLRNQFAAAKESKGITQAIDVHWAVSSRQLFARALPYEELAEDAVPLPQSGFLAETPCAVHALLIACMHRVAHRLMPYYTNNHARIGGDRLIWLYDIHLLAEGLGDPEWEGFLDMAAEKGLRRVCLDGLLAAKSRFETRLPPRAEAELSAGWETEPSAAYLDGGNLHLTFTELRALPGWRERLALLREHLFPPGDYLLHKYGAESRAWLPVLYLRRNLCGLKNFFAES